MTLKVFLFISILVVFLLLAFCVFERTKIFPDVDDHDILNRRSTARNAQYGIIARIILYSLFVVVAMFAIWTARTYIYPNKKPGDGKNEMFTNVRYHVLSHNGYLLGEQFYLARGITSSSAGFTNEALWDSKDGEVELVRKDSCMLITQFIDPIYFRQAQPKKWYEKIQLGKEKNAYVLQNQVIKEDVSEGFELWQDGKLRYALEIQHYIPSIIDRLFADDERLKEEQYFYISRLYKSDNECIRDTSSFNKIIQHGYPLMDIIARSPKIDVDEEIERWFTGSYLVRTKIPLKGNRFGFDKKHPASLCLMPGLSFYLQDGVSINNTEYDFDTTFHVPFNEYAQDNKVRFFSGVGTRQSEEFCLSYQDSTHMYLELRQHNMRQLREMDGRVFITSSTDEIAKDAREGGYLYNKFSDNKNLNHINANIRYKVGTARDSLCFAVLDINDQLTGERHVYHSDEPFYLKTCNKTKNAIQWVFEVKNMRETNDLQIRHILLFIILMLLAVTIRIVSDTWLELRSLSIFEFGLYIVLLSLSVVKLILGWRASTFAPIESIALPIYEKMRHNIYDWTFWIIWLLPIFVATYTCLARLNEKNHWWDKQLKRLENRVSQFKFGDMKLISVIYGVSLLVLWGLSHVPLLERLCHIAFPLLLYYLIEIWMELRSHGNHSESFIKRRIVHGIIMFGYLFIADAGFTIVFVVSLLLYEGVLKGLFNGKTRLHGREQYVRYIIATASIIAIYCILRFEGEIMISIFNYPGWWVFGFFTILCAYTIWEWTRNKSKKWVLILAGLCMLFAISGVIESTTDKMNVYHALVNSKAHMRYRAEIQQLGKGEKIDDIIEKSDYDSGDIVYIMRTAHNQWFINQYIRAGKNMEEDGCSFRLQPHSNQGSPYPTQTTDLVVTRYILAEHGEMVAREILFLWALLITIFIMEVMMSNGINISCVASGIMIYTVSLLVFLSATNRIVFIGQDFPMISIQSRMALLFPIFLFCIPLFRAVYVRQSHMHDTDDKETDYKGLLFGAMIWIIMLLGMHIEQKGKAQEASQFNVSTLIDNVVDKVSLINERFAIFQQENRKKLKKMDKIGIWNAFLSDSSSDIYYKLRDDESKENMFLHSALLFFEQKQTSKIDVNQLLHLRMRGGICYLGVDKQHYFIPAIMEEEMQWCGNLFAAYVDPNLTLYGLNTTDKIKLDSKKDYDKNILDKSLIQQVPNMPLMWFGSDWTPDDTPLLLLSSEQGIGQSEYFCIEMDTLEIKSSGKNNQIATALMPGDVFSLNRANRDNGKSKPKVIYQAKLREDGVNYIARNIWLNGHRQLFYPLGKESMWTYHFANLTSSALSDTALLNHNPAYRDTSLHLSIDFDLCQELYNTMRDEAKTAKRIGKMSDKVRDRIEKFIALDKTSISDSIHRDMYFDIKQNKVVVKRGAKEEKGLRPIVALLNKRLKQDAYKHEEPHTRLRHAIDYVLQRPFDFTAVAIDGDGHIRALFDYTQRQRIDPNNITHLSKLMSELYLDGSTVDERDMFGSKALQHMAMGAGSSFKPITYTAVTSQERLDWKTINLKGTGIEAAQASEKEKSQDKVLQFRYYGGVDVIGEARESSMNIDTEHGYKYSDYLYKSDNIYHSLIIMFGLQPIGQVKNVIRSAEGLTSERAFPVFSYGNKAMCSFDPEVWYKGDKGQIVKQNSILTRGLTYNYRLEEGASRVSSDRCHNYFGSDTIIEQIYNYPSSARSWSFAERGSQNTADRRQSPKIHNGFNQMILGAYPLELTSLQMAVNTKRLASLNRANNITTLLDNQCANDYQFFDIGEGWSENSYIEFVGDVVWKQMRQSAIKSNEYPGATAKRLDGLRQNMEAGKFGRPYYLYCKTGTLSDKRVGANPQEDKIKHLMVIITDKPLENCKNLEELRHVKSYSIYLSYFGVKKGFQPDRFKPYIEKIMKSATFQAYMNPKKEQER